VATFVATVRGRRKGGSPAPSGSPALSVAADALSIPDQIRKLGELRDVGLFTDEEFEGKKAELRSSGSSYCCSGR
jgi:hypothetical protein